LDGHSLPYAVAHSWQSRIAFVENPSLVVHVQTHPDNFLLGVRGNALTHDLDLGRQTLQGLRDLNQGGGDTPGVRIPQYDKSAHEGRGDRLEEGSWPVVEAPLDVVLFEGWMLGFSPIADADAEKVGVGA